MNRLGGAAVAAEVLSPFDVQGVLPKKLRPRYFHSATGNFCRGLSGCLQQFGKGMARYLEVSYSGFRHLGLGSDFWLFTHSIVGANKLAPTCYAVGRGAELPANAAGRLIQRPKIASNPR